MIHVERRAEPQATPARAPPTLLAVQVEQHLPGHPLTLRDLNRKALATLGGGADPYRAAALSALTRTTAVTMLREPATGQQAGATRAPEQQANR